MMLNPVTQSFIDFKLRERQGHYSDVQQYRNYANGEQAIHLTNAQKILLVGADSAGNPNSNPEFVLNVCNTILDVETDRLEIQSIAVNVEGNEELSDDLSKRAWQWFKASRMDEGQQNAHYAAARDADSFGFAYYDKDKLAPRLAINPLYDGEDNGADMFYVDDDPTQPEAAVKIWTISETDQRKIRRKNIYYPDRIEYWICEGVLTGAYAQAGWRPLRFSDPDWQPTMTDAPSLQSASLSQTATIEWWTDSGNERGRPLGIPVFHFRHQARGTAYGRSTIADVVPGLQDAVNRAGVSLMAAAQLSGFKVTTANGIDREAIQDLRVYPGAIIASTEGSFGQLAESDLLQLIEVLNAYIKNAATLTNTPLSFFNLGGQAPAEGSQKQLELGLLAKTRRNQTSFGNTWEDAIRYMFKLDSIAAGGETLLTWEQIDDLDISIVWEPADVRNELTEIQVAEAHQRLGVPQKFIWRKLGYSEDDIAQFEQEADVKRAQAMGQMAQKIRELETAANVGGNNGTNGATNPIPAGASGGNGSQPTGA